jgi:ATP phosphoribosyltransferase
VTILLAIPSKGRLMASTESLLNQAGLKVSRAGDDRGYRGRLEGLDGVDLVFVSATEIARSLADGSIDCGITGEDVLREAVPPEDEGVAILARLPFGNADVVVAVPEAWLDVATMADLDEVSVGFYEKHGRRLRVATKYKHLTRRFFADKGVSGYRIVDRRSSRRRHRRSHRRHHHHRLDARRQSPEDTGRRHHLEIAGRSRGARLLPRRPRRGSAAIEAEQELVTGGS